MSCLSRTSGHPSDIRIERRFLVTDTNVSEKAKENNTTNIQESNSVTHYKYLHAQRNSYFLFLYSVVSKVINYHEHNQVNGLY